MQAVDDELRGLIRSLDAMLTIIAVEQLTLREYLARAGSFDAKLYREVSAAVHVAVTRRAANQTEPSLDALLEMLTSDPGGLQ